MNKQTLFSALFLMLLVVSSCQPNRAIDNLSQEEMLRLVRELDNQFGKGVMTKDSSLLVSIYTDSAQYVQPNRKILKGKNEIGSDWAGFIRMKANPVNLLFNIKEVSGNREIIYETGNGYTLLQDSTHWNFNYVNVWRLQKNGSYKLDIDVYTPL